MQSKLQPLLLRSLVKILSEGKDLLGKIEDCHYASEENGTFSGGAVGGYFRHCLESINCFLAGAAVGHIDYEKRDIFNEDKKILSFSIS